MEDGKFVTIRQAAKLTGVTEYALRQMYKAGTLPGYSNLNGTKFHVNLDELRDRIICGDNESDDVCNTKKEKFVKDYYSRVEELLGDSAELYRSVDDIGCPKSHIFINGHEMFSCPYSWESKLIAMITGDKHE